MTTYSHHLTKLLLLATSAILACATALAAPDKAGEPAQAQTDAIAQSTKMFNDLADQALLAMKQRAEALKIKGVAVVAFVPGDEVTCWCSKMLVVGQLKTDSSTNNPGSNLLAIAYAKASEMADTLKPSGSGARPRLIGELGWQGGWIAQGKTGHIIAAFSGGRSEDDVMVSKTGVGVLAGAL